MASLKSISAKGEVIITFSEEMNVPPLNVIKATKVTLKGRVVPALELEIKAGFYSEVDNLTFSYNITENPFKLIYQLHCSADCLSIEL